ncbi:hypothetical protein [Fibrella forsythiae]|uniref:Uncharacterized protein n=1 Tax=Fibrella forsythiae TaxID=2817061 RepID=A0ABS3JPR3_9BACT|nr:hypothetical protein [Fibrella forsythiae]MBO0951996.1 hypothetical protein [Fibrella forsythiae]
MKAANHASHHILVDEPGLLLAQCRCCGEIELYFRNITMALNLIDLYALIRRLDNLATASRYIVGLLDVRDTTVRAGFQAIGLQLTEGERDQLARGLNLACLRLDLDLLMRGRLSPN